MSGAASVCWALIPIKGSGEGKTRLSGALDAAGRVALVNRMLERVVTAAGDCPAVARICLVGPDDHGLGGAIHRIEDRGADLNSALAAAVAQVEEDGARIAEGAATTAASRLLIIAADLPRIDGRDIAMLAAVPETAVGIAPDRHGTGTNALSLPIAAASAFRFRFGQGSYAAHRAEAERLGYTVETILSDGLEKDVDEPADVADARDCLKGAL